MRQRHPTRSAIAVATLPIPTLVGCANDAGDAARLQYHADEEEMPSPPGEDPVLGTRATIIAVEGEAWWTARVTGVS